MKAVLQDTPTALELAIPAFNIPYLPMMEPVVQAVVDLDSFALIDTARLEWIKFEAGGLAQVAREFARWNKPGLCPAASRPRAGDRRGQPAGRLPAHLSAKPSGSGYESLMVDGSRLRLEENIQAMRPVVDLAHAAGIPVEAELGAVLGHENGPLPSYEELYASGKGFTDPDEARHFVSRDRLRLALGGHRQHPRGNCRRA